MKPNGMFAAEDWITGRCSNVNFRPESHGDKKVMAADIDIAFDLPNTVLDQFHPDLRAALYTSIAGTKGQASVEGVPEVLPNFKFPKLTLPLRWEGKWAGYAFHLDYGLGAERQSDLALENSKLHKFTFTPKEGGTTTVTCQVQNSSDDLTQEVRGILSELPVLPSITFKLIAPEIPQEEAPPKKGKPADDDTNPLPFDGGGDEDDGEPKPGTPEHAFINSVHKRAAAPVAAKKAVKVTHKKSRTVAKKAKAKR